MVRVSEFFAGMTARNAILFTGKKRHLPSVEVRGVQMAEELNGHCLRYRYLRTPTVRSSKALIWICEAALEQVRRFNGLTPQVYEPINLRIDPTGAFQEACRSFEFLILNTQSAINWLGPAPETGWKHWVIPHHHCNYSGFQLSEDRLEKPKVVGYVGERIHLHDFEEIRDAIEKHGMEFLVADAYDLDAYKRMDIGIAWTRREELRDQTRSNVKLTNFNAFGIPSVVCDYESYRTTDEALGGGSCLIRSSLNDFIEGLAQLIQNEELRQRCHQKSIPALTSFSRSKIAERYQQLEMEVNKGFLRAE